VTGDDGVVDTLGGLGKTCQTAFSTDGIKAIGATGQQFMGMSDMFQEEYTLIINLNNAVIKKLPDLDNEKKELLIGQIYALATLCNKPLTPDELTDFVSRNNKILGMII